MHNVHVRKQQQQSPSHLLAQLLLFFVICLTLLQAMYQSKKKSFRQAETAMMMQSLLHAMQAFGIWGQLLCTGHFCRCCCICGCNCVCMCGYMCMVYLACASTQSNNMDNTLESWACSAAKDAACSVSPPQNLRARVACKTAQQTVRIPRHCHPAVVLLLHDVVSSCCCAATKLTLLRQHVLQSLICASGRWSGTTSQCCSHIAHRHAVGRSDSHRCSRTVCDCRTGPEKYVL